MKTRVKELVKYRRNGITKTADCAVFEEERMLRERKKKMGALVASGKVLPSVMKKDKPSSTLLGSTVDDKIVALGNRLTNSVKPRQALPGCELLSHREKKLCHSIGLRPAAYITIKTCIIRDYLQRQQGAPVKIRYPAQLDKVRRRRMLSFFVENGWISVAS
jgi:transcriptional adapter 2-beta